MRSGRSIAATGLDGMQRRSFIGVLGAAAAVAPLRAGAQPTPATMPVIGFLQVGMPEPAQKFVEAFNKGLAQTGFVAGRNVAIEYRWARNDTARLPELAAELVRRRVNVIATPGTTAAALAAKAATKTIPIVFGAGFDPVESGLVASFNRPGGNVTGVSSMNVELGGKRLSIMRDLLPKATRFAVLVDPNTPFAKSEVEEVQAAAATIGWKIDVLNASTSGEIETAFEQAVQMHIDALLIGPEVLFSNRRVQMVTLAARHALPVIYSARDFVEIGGLVSYGSSALDRDRQTGVYTGRVLKGEKPADLPVMRATRFELVVNQPTAKSLGVPIPPTLFVTADEVIE
jgi:putative tryptophan/tyrosine transport system substrate-binding protein